MAGTLIWTIITIPERNPNQTWNVRRAQSGYAQLVSRERTLPDVEVLVAWRAEGLTQQQMADRINESNRRVLADAYVPVTRSAVSVALSRAAKADTRPRYPNKIPWSPIAPEHQKDHLLTMLRTWARIVHEDPTVPDAARHRYERFRDRLLRDGQVVDYSAAEGFHLVDRRPGVDTGLIRDPYRT